MGISTNATISWPIVKPTTICIYENLSTATEPGIEINVTPDIAAPIIARVAIYQVVRRLPMKNPRLSASRPEIYAAQNSRSIYPISVIMVIIGDIKSKFYRTKILIRHKIIVVWNKFYIFVLGKSGPQTRLVSYYNKLFNFRLWPNH